jgi:IclR family transcriptional regulator, acetate operon repressor
VIWAQQAIDALLALQDAADAPPGSRSGLLRELAIVRRVGSAIESEEAVLGNACVAAPIFGSPGHLLAAVSISGPPMRLRPVQRAPVVRRTAAKITQRIGGQLPEGSR